MCERHLADARVRNQGRGHVQHPKPNSGDLNRAKTHCPKGHPYSEANTYRYKPGARICRTCRLRSTAEWERKHPEWKRAKKRRLYARDRKRFAQRASDYRRALKLKVFHAYGNGCACCGESTYEFLSLDHVNNDGAAHRKRLTGKSRTQANSAIFREIIASGFPPTFQLLCMNCNCAKAWFGACPHKKTKGLQRV